MLFRSDKFDFYYEERGQKYNDPNNYLQLAFGDWKEKELKRLHYQEEREKLYEEEMQALEDEIAHLAKRRAIMVLLRDVHLECYQFSYRILR